MSREHLLAQVLIGCLLTVRRLWYGVGSEFELTLFIGEHGNMDGMTFIKYSAVHVFASAMPKYSCCS